MKLSILFVFLLYSVGKCLGSFSPISSTPSNSICAILSSTYQILSVNIFTEYYAFCPSHVRNTLANRQSLGVSSSTHLFEKNFSDRDLFEWSSYENCRLVNFICRPKPLTNSSMLLEEPVRFNGSLSVTGNVTEPTPDISTSSKIVFLDCSRPSASSTNGTDPSWRRWTTIRNSISHQSCHKRPLQCPHLNFQSNFFHK